jgi:hypothetical protein
MSAENKLSAQLDRAVQPPPLSKKSSGGGVFLPLLAIDCG